MIVAGADGCPAGWFVASDDGSGSAPRAYTVGTIAECFARRGAPHLLAIDIPIGLPDSGFRACDVRARRLLGVGRGSSVFPAPIRPVLGASSYEEANRIRRAIEGKGLSKQTWAIVRKVREVDDALRASAEARSRVREIHPELCFFAMAGNRSMRFGKKTTHGRAERLQLLEAAFPGRIVPAAIEARERPKCAPDDVVDAFVALWTARRIRDGVAITIPEREVPRDHFGLPMEMVA